MLYNVLHIINISIAKPILKIENSTPKTSPDLPFLLGSLKLFNSKSPNKNKAVLYHYSTNRPKKSQNARTKNNQIIHLNELGYT